MNRYFIDVTSKHIIKKTLSSIVISLIGAVLFTVLSIVFHFSMDNNYVIILPMLVSIYFSVKSYIFLYNNEFSLISLFKEYITIVKRLFEPLMELHGYIIRGYLQYNSQEDRLILSKAPETIVIIIVALALAWLFLSR